MTAKDPDMNHLETHLRSLQSALSEELDLIHSWDSHEARASTLARAKRTARLDAIELPEVARMWAMPKAQQVQVNLSLKLIADDGRSSTRDDPRGRAFKAMAQDLIAMMPSDTAVQEK